MSFVAAWFRAFALTCAVELALALPLLGRRYSIARRVVAVLLAELATHPAVWFLWPALGLRRALYLSLAESFAVLVEFALYALVFPELGKARALAISALCNGTSLAVGLALRCFFVVAKKVS